MGETFSGVDFATGVEAAREFAALVPDGITAAQAALALIAQLPEVSTVIPGARNPEQARANAEAGARATWATTSGEASARSTTATSGPPCTPAGSC